MTLTLTRLKLLSVTVASLAGVITLSACNGERSEAQKPASLIGMETRTYYGGEDNDLLTAGLGTAGLRGAEPKPADPLAPTLEEIRRLTIYSNFRALVDVTDDGGYGRLYGPKGDGKAGGYEYLVMGHIEGLNHPVTYMIQVPDNFDAGDPCLVTAPSSGGRTVYGAVGTVGSWALPKGCAVAYTDKATGIGMQFLGQGLVYDMHGRLVKAGEGQSPFQLEVTEALKAYAQENPDHIALKHAHSKDNSMKDWGQTVLESIRVGFYILNKYHRPEEAGKTYNKETVTVIASSISNGGYSSLKAAEQDTEGLIDAVVVSEPNVSPDMAGVGPVSIAWGDHELAVTGRQFLDYSSKANVLMACALLAEPADVPLKLFIPLGDQGLANRCRTLAEKGLVRGETAEEQSRDARAQLGAYGFLEDSSLMDGFSVFSEIWPAVVGDYAPAFGRYGVEDDLCGVAIGATGKAGKLEDYPLARKHVNFAKSTGMIPSNDINWVRKSADGWKRAQFTPNAENGLLDHDATSALCFDDKVRNDPAILKGRDEVRNSADLGGRPAIIVHGRRDSLIHVNFSSRPYYALNKLREGGNSGLSFYEVRNGQHFDALAMLPAFAAKLAPMHYYFEQSLDLMWDHLKKGTPLPPSQLLDTRERGMGADGKVPPLGEKHLPEIAAEPGDMEITFDGSRLNVPE
ncbi:3-hydroxybutyrate oligomer hydrolase family protein [Emcibacter sp.]|uniref:3-hydroxybutyrate oligomer hydrolase family protein n=1 Tax=Emcibacter sp. TaxID=1979954 RepID=UPI002AA8BCFC|nr:3-hydroxybutyrate oligomer hydrolase family protein [Emcibacter sp.]